MIEINNISKSFGSNVVLDGVNCKLKSGELLGVLGKSGSGKSTILKILSGLLSPDSGELIVDGRNVLNEPAHKRNIVYLGQEPNLFPHLDVASNLGFGLKIRKSVNYAERVKEISALLEIGDLLNRMPHELSGGQKQRVAFGRALAVNPSILLLDEPFSSLDPGLRSQMQQFFIQLKEQLAITGMFVTHDIKECLTVGDRIVRLTEGKFRYYANSREVLDDPETGAKDEVNFWKNHFKSNGE